MRLVDRGANRHLHPIARYRQYTVGTQLGRVFAVDHNATKWLAQDTVHIDGLRGQRHAAQCAQRGLTGAATDRHGHLQARCPGSAIDMEVRQGGGVSLACPNGQLAGKVQFTTQFRLGYHTARAGDGATNETHLAIAAGQGAVGSQVGGQLCLLQAAQRAVTIDFDQASLHRQRGLTRGGCSADRERVGFTELLDQVLVAQRHMLSAYKVRAWAFRLNGPRVQTDRAQLMVLANQIRAFGQHHAIIGTQLDAVESRLVERLRCHHTRIGVCQGLLCGLVDGSRHHHAALARIV